MPDIDIDVPDRSQVLELFQHVPAIINEKKGHNTGIYFHNMPKNPLTGKATIDYKEAAEIGYFKIDLLNVSIYKQVKDHDHLDRLINHNPVWEKLQDKEFCNQLFHLRGHHRICQIMKPNSILKLAAVLAIIRPAKRHLIGKSWEKILETIWDEPTDGSYHFKKAHAHSYALAVKIHMGLLTEAS